MHLTQIDDFDAYDIDESRGEVGDPSDRGGRADIEVIRRCGYNNESSQ